MTQKFVRLTLMFSLVMGASSLLHHAFSTAQVDPKKDPAKANKLDAPYMGVVTKYEAKDKGALIKITMVNTEMRGYPEYKDNEVYIHPSRIDQIHGGPFKVGVYLKFHMLSPQPLPNYYSPLKKDAQGHMDSRTGNRMIVGVPEIVHNPQQVILPLTKNQGGINTTH